MSDIPAARDLVTAARQRVEKLDREAADLLARAEQMMWRDPPGKPRAPRESGAITTEMKARILAFHRRNRRASILSIANKFGVGTGRVSEVINGKR